MTKKRAVDRREYSEGSNRRPSLNLCARFGSVTAALLLALSAFFGPSHAQDLNEGVTFEDLGFTDRLAVGARAAGMAGAYLGAADDVHALVYNPAGLARVRRIDVSLGFQYTTSNLKSTFYRNAQETDFSSMTLDGLAAAYPVPTYRGSLVIAGGVYRTMSADLDMVNRGFNEDTNTNDEYLLQQSGSIYAYVLGAGMDLSPQISVGISGFILDGTINALTQFAYRYPPPLEDGDLEGVALFDDAEVDLDGYGLTLGVQYNPHRFLHCGLVVTTPIAVDLQGGAATEEARYYVNIEDQFLADRVVIDAEYTIPFRIATGASFTTPDVLLNLDLGYTGWKQSEVNGVKLKDENLDSIFREAVDVRIGGEFLVPRSPVRLRAGYALRPFALKYLQADRIEGDDIQKANIDTERQTFAAGFGLLLDRVFTIDASYEYQMGKRSIPSLVDDRTSQRVLVTGSYRF